MPFAVLGYGWHCVAATLALALVNAIKMPANSVEPRLELVQMDCSSSVDLLCTESRQVVKEIFP